jgi:hypothetical protein
LHGGIARALLAQRVEVILHRLDVDAVPAVIVEGFGDRVVARVIGADIDVETVFELLECAPQADVFKILCIRNERHDRFLSVRFFLFECALPARCVPVIARVTRRCNCSLGEADFRRLCRFDWRLMHN